MKNLYDVELGLILKQVRKDRNLSMSSVGEKLGLTKQAINHYESGRVPLTVTQLKKICAIYDVSWYEIMKEADINLIGKTNDKQV